MNCGRPITGKPAVPTGGFFLDLPDALCYAVVVLYHGRAIQQRSARRAGTYRTRGDGGGGNAGAVRKARRERTETGG